MAGSEPTELAALLAEVRRLRAGCDAADQRSLATWRDLASLLLTRTVLADGVAPRMFVLDRNRTRGTLGGMARAGDALPLRDHGFLRLTMSLAIRHQRMLVEESAFQYQLDAGDRRWVFRYDYRRTPRDTHPAAHLQIRGAFLDDPPSGRETSRIHFPTGRPSLEGVIRLLIEEFHVPSATSPEVWRPMLALSEAQFVRSASSPRSDPLPPG